MIYKPVSSWGRTNDKDFKYCHLCGDILSGVRGQGCVLAIDWWAGRGSTSLTTAQTPVPNQHNMSTPYWNMSASVFFNGRE